MSATLALRQTDQILDIRRRQRSLLGLFWLCGLLMLMLAAIASPDWGGWSTALLVIGPALLAVAVFRTSIITSAYLVQVGIYFGVTSWIVGSAWPPRLVSTVIAWSVAIAAGSLAGSLLRPSNRTIAPRVWRKPRWPHYALSAGLIAVSGYLALSGFSGYSAQILSGRSTPTGILGTLSVAAPVVTLTLVLTSIGSGNRSHGVILLALAQMLVLALSGFRGAAGTFIVALLVGAALTLPRDSRWLRKTRLTLVIPILIILAITTFVIGANVKNTAATNARVSSTGTRLFTAGNAVKNTSTRLELSSSLEAGLEHRGDNLSADGISWEDQLQAAVPRLLWPGKPNVDYGQRVTISIYGGVSIRSSSTITTIGDSLLNFGPLGLVLAGILVGVVFRQVEIRLLRGTGWLSLLVGAVIIYSSVGQEEPIIILIIGMIKAGAIAAILWAAASALPTLSSHADPPALRAEG